MTATGTERLLRVAIECLLEGQKAVSGLDAESWLRMAKEWAKLARDAERRSLKSLVGSRGTPIEWSTVTHNGMPAWHYPPNRRELADRFATDPAYWQHGSNKKKYH